VRAPRRDRARPAPARDVPGPVPGAGEALLAVAPPIDAVYPHDDGFAAFDHAPRPGTFKTRPMPDTPTTTALTAAERRLALWLRGLAMLFAMGAIGALLRADEIVRNMNAVGGMLRMRELAVPSGPMASDFWFALAVANLAGNAVCAWLGSTDARGRRAFAYPVVVSHLVSGGTAVLLLVRWAVSFPILALAVVDLAISAILIGTLQAAKGR